VGTAEFSMTGEVVLITGCRRGIGRALALAFAEAGADVAVCNIWREGGELQALATEIEKLGRHALPVYADTTKKSDVENMVQKVMDEFGRIDVLVNNAGIALKSPVVDFPESDWDRMISTNLKGYLLCAQAVAKRMIAARRGTIINTASQYAFKVTPGMGLYSVSKAGVAMLTRALAQELGKHGIRVNAVAPALIKNEVTQDSWSDPQFMKELEASLPLGRIGEIADLLGVYLFLASSSAQYITGHTLLVDG
jgi:NAD(P)-dependent dehydrogenase (short-subunit alcohol dehydrogenase family)